MARGLTLKEAAFVDAYVSDETRNATAAARAAGYKGNADAMTVQAARTLGRARVQEAIAAKSKKAIAIAEARGEAAVMSRAEAIERLSIIARGNLPDLLTEGGALTAQAIKGAPRGFVREITTQERVLQTQGEATVLAREIKVKGESVKAALESIIKAHDDAEGLRHPTGQVNVLVQMIQALPTGQAKTKYIDLLAEGDDQA